jgi:ubiquinone/menaquinone biosynthesis C-methylase UbiE
MGQTLIASDLRGALACGVDPDIEALRLGGKLSRQIRLVGGAAEMLPVRTGWAEFAIARLSLPYTHIPETVREVYRVLQAGGQFWTVLHPLAMTLQNLRSSIVHRRGRAVFYQLYTLLNGFALHVSGRQFRYPLNRTRCESFQTVSGIKRILHHAGFQAISVIEKPFFVASARKPQQPSSS